MRTIALTFCYAIVVYLLTIISSLILRILQNSRRLNWSITGENMVSKKQKAEAPEQQINLLELDERWKEHYGGMPSFNQKDQSPYQSITVHFAERKDLVEFCKLVKQTITRDTKYIWYPESERQVWDKEWKSES